MGSKKFKGKECAYCRSTVSSTEDHVVARALLSLDQRMDRPKVPACKTCNGRKSRLEGEVLTTLLAGTQAGDSEAYRRDFVRPRLAKNHRAARELGLYESSQLVSVNGVLRPMHLLRVDPTPVLALVEMMCLGLYYHHFGRGLSKSFAPQSTGLADPRKKFEAEEAVSTLCPPGSVHVEDAFGSGEFEYAGMRSLHHPDISVWRMRIHRITLHGRNGPPQGSDTWMTTTLPTDEALSGLSDQSDVSALV